jgi:hypothetical protein
MNRGNWTVAAISMDIRLYESFEPWSLSFLASAFARESLLKMLQSYTLTKRFQLIRAFRSHNDHGLMLRLVAQCIQGNRHIKFMSESRAFRELKGAPHRPSHPIPLPDEK